MMKVKYTLLTLISILTGSVIAASSVSATETKTATAEVQFTFDSVLTIALSSDEIAISGLAPGTSGKSNEIGVTVNTNNNAGYVLSATVGDSSNASTNLTHTDGSATFASIASGTSVTSLTTDSTWGYSINSGSTYSGLPLYTATGATLASSTGASNTTTTFLIGAKAASSQLSGDYSNVINFIAVPNV